MGRKVNCPVALPTHALWETRSRGHLLPVACSFALLGNPVVSPPDANISKPVSGELCVYSALYTLIFESAERNSKYVTFS